MPQVPKVAPQQIRNRQYPKAIAFSIDDLRIQCNLKLRMRPRLTRITSSGRSNDSHRQRTLQIRARAWERKAGMTGYSQYRPLPITQVEKWDFETDVAVIGFGATGACAAIAARVAGAEGLLFERSSGRGGG